MPEKHPYTSRAASMEDVGAVAELFNARSRRSYGQDQVKAESLARQWSGELLQISEDVRLFFDQEDRLAGYACVPAPRPPFIEVTYAVAAHPERESDASLWDVMICWCSEKDRLVLSKAPDGAAVHAGASALVEDEVRWAAYERHGFQRVRVEHRLRTELDREIPEPQWPEGFTLPAFDIETELEKLVALDQEAFRDHWGHVERPFDEEVRGWQEWIQELGSDLDPSLWFVARAGDELAGYVVCEPEIPGDTACGYVSGFAVRAMYRKRGLGLALLHHAFRELKHRGKTAVELDMDSENLTGASRVYARAGMVPIRQMLLYEKRLREGEDLTVRSLDQV